MNGLVQWVADWLTSGTANEPKGTVTKTLTQYAALRPTGYLSTRSDKADLIRYLSFGNSKGLRRTVTVSIVVSEWEPFPNTTEEDR